MSQNKSYIYLITNKYNTVIYTGVASNLIQRVFEHKENKYRGFSSKYNINKLVYYEIFDRIEDAIIREKQIKAGSQANKEELIIKTNPEWDDLYKEIC